MSRSVPEFWPSTVTLLLSPNGQLKSPTKAYVTRETYPRSFRGHAFCRRPKVLSVDKGYRCGSVLYTQWRCFEMFYRSDCAYWTLTCPTKKRDTVVSIEHNTRTHPHTRILWKRLRSCTVHQRRNSSILCARKKNNTHTHTHTHTRTYIYTYTVYAHRRPRLSIIICLKHEDS
jgi:hypothetical protein